MGCMKRVWRMAGQMMDGMKSMALGMMPCAGVGDRLVPAAGGGLRVDVCEGLDEVFVVADLPGVEKENIVVQLLSPAELGISGARCSERAETAEGGQFKRLERTCGRMDRVVPLPSDATGEGATASFENGVLTVRLRKAERGERIPIE